MLVYSIFQLPSWFFFGGVWSARDSARAKTSAGGGTTFQSARLHPRLVASRVRSPRGGFLPPFRFGPLRFNAVPFFVSEFRSLCCRMFFVCFEQISPVFLFCLLVGYFCRLFRLMWFDHFPGSSCWAEKRLLVQNVRCLRSTFWMWWWMASFYLE